MEPKKYVFSERTTGYFGRILHQIKAITDFGSVHKGDLGGWIEYEENLSQEGTCWIFDDAKVFGEARVCDEAEVFGEACVGGEAKVYGKAKVYGEAEVFGKAKVYGEAEVFGKAKVFDKACVHGKAEVSGKAYVSGEAKVFDKAVITGTTTLRTTAYVQSQYDLLSIENIGSRNGATTLYKTKEGGIDVACGCFRGSIEEFEKAVEETHGDNENGRVYKNTINYVKCTISTH